MKDRGLLRKMMSMTLITCMIFGSLPAAPLSVYADASPSMGEAAAGADAEGWKASAATDEKPSGEDAEQTRSGERSGEDAEQTRSGEHSAEDEGRAGELSSDAEKGELSEAAQGPEDASPEEMPAASDGLMPEGSSPGSGDALAAVDPKAEDAKEAAQREKTPEEAPYEEAVTEETLPEWLLTEKEFSSKEVSNEATPTRGARTPRIDEIFFLSKGRTSLASEMPAGWSYNQTTGTLTIDNPVESYSTGALIVKTDSADRLHLTVDFKNDLRIYAPDAEVPGAGTFGAANMTGGDLTLTSSTGAKVFFDMTDSRESADTKSTGACCIYSLGDIHITGDLNLEANSYNGNSGTRHPGQYATAIRSDSGTVSISGTAQVYAYAGGMDAGISGDRINAAVRAYGGLIVTSSARQVFELKSYSLGQGAVICSDGPDAFFSLGTDSSGKGSCVEVRFLWDAAKAGNHFLWGASNISDTLPEMTGYKKSAVDGGWAYTALNDKAIDLATIKLTLPKIGGKPVFANAYTVQTKGVTLTAGDFYYQKSGQSSWTKIIPTSADVNYNSVPLDVTKIKAEYTLQTQEGYIFTDELRGEIQNVDNVIAPKTLANQTLPNTAVFEKEFGRELLTPPDVAQYISVNNLPAIKNGDRPWSIGSTQTEGSEKGQIGADERYKWANLSNLPSTDPLYTANRYREWWTYNGQLMDRNSSNANLNKFQATKKYTYHALLQTKDGYAFGGGIYPNTSLHEFVNGFAAFSTYPDEGVQKYLHITREFTCPAESINEVEVFNVPIPAAGQQAMMNTGTVAEGAPYEKIWSGWRQGRDYTSGYGITEDNLSAQNFTGTFQENTWYTYIVQLRPVDNTYRFAATEGSIVFSGMNAYVNGQKCGTVKDGPYCNTIRYTAPGSAYPNGMLQLRYSFLVSAAEENTIREIELNVRVLDLRAGGSWGDGAAINPPNISVSTLKNAPSYPQIATNDRFSYIRDKQVMVLQGDDPFGQQYNQTVYGNDNFYPYMGYFSSNETYTVYSVVDLGENYFDFDPDGRIRTTVTVNGYPGSLSVGTTGNDAQINFKSHKALVRMVYKIPETRTKWIYVPEGCRVTHKIGDVSTQLAKAGTRNGYDYFAFSQGGELTVSKDGWSAPEGESFWKWDVTVPRDATEAGEILPYPYSPNVTIASAPDKDLVFRILTAPAGQVPTDISTRNKAIQIKGWANNWGGPSSSGGSDYDGTAKLCWPEKIVNTQGTSDESDDYILMEGKDYTLSYSGDNVNAGSVFFDITGIGDYDGKRTYSYSIWQTAIGQTEVTVFAGNTDYTTTPPMPWTYWTGEAQQPNFRVHHNGRVLTEGTDYEIVGWQYNTDVGTAVLTIKGLGNYRSSRYVMFQIRARDINNASVELASEVNYTGSYQRPPVTLSFGGEVLTEGSDFSVQYKNNLDAKESTAAMPPSVTITGLGGWSGTRTETFSILPMDLNDPKLSWETIEPQQYSEEAVTKDSELVRLGSTWLSPGNDYTLSYENNIYPGEATLTLTGMQNYTGTKQLRFTIRAALNGWYMSYEGLESSYYATGSQIKPEPTAVRLGSKTLTKGVEYDLEWGENTESGGATGYVNIVPASGNPYFYNSLVHYFNIVELPAPMYLTWGTDEDGCLTANWNGVAGAKEYYVTLKKDGEWCGTACLEQTGDPHGEYDEHGTPYSYHLGGLVNNGGSGTYHFEVHARRQTEPELIQSDTVVSETKEITTYPLIAENGAAMDMHGDVLHSAAPGTRITLACDEAPYPALTEFDHFEVSAAVTDYDAIERSFTMPAAEVSLRPVYAVCGMEIGKISTKLTPAKTPDFTTAFDAGGKLNHAVLLIDQYWKDTSTGAEIRKGGSVLPVMGHSYEFFVKLEAKDGFCFRGDKFAPFLLDGTAVAATKQNKTLNSDGTVTLHWGLTAKCQADSLKDAALAARITGVGNQTFSGAAQTPSPVVQVKIGGAYRTLKKDTDYTLSYKDNTNAGTATLTVTGKGDYKDSLSVNFKINPVSLAGAKVSGVQKKTYTGKAQTLNPTVTMTLGGKTVTLKEGRDYTLSYQNNTAVGTATMTVTGKGNYGGKLEKKFAITKAPAKWTRLAGTTALDTMEAVTKEFGSAKTAVIATNASYQDLLAAAALAGSLGAPMMTTEKGKLSVQTERELKRMGIQEVYLIGTTGDIAEAVVTQIKARTKAKTVRRITGTSVAAKAVACATAQKSRSDTVIISTQNNFKDALSISPYAYATKSPILYAEKNKTLSDATLKYIKGRYKKAIIVGGPDPLPASIETQLQKSAGIAASKITRLAGLTQYDTSLIIAEWATGKLKNGTGGNGASGAKGTYKYAAIRFQPNQLLKADKLGVSRADSAGNAWKDALTGSALCGKNQSVLILADDNDRDRTAAAVTFISANKAQINTAYIFGGKAAVSEAVRTKLQNASK